MIKSVDWHKGLDAAFSRGKIRAIGVFQDDRFGSLFFTSRMSRNSLEDDYISGGKYFERGIASIVGHALGASITNVPRYNRMTRALERTNPYAGVIRLGFTERVLSPEEGFAVKDTCDCIPQFALRINQYRNSELGVIVLADKASQAYDLAAANPITSPLVHAINNAMGKAYDRTQIFYEDAGKVCVGNLQEHKSLV